MTFAAPFPRRSSCGSRSTTPTHETTESQSPAISPTAASAPSRSAATHLTSFVHGSSDAQAGQLPDLETLVTSAPLDTSTLQTREPTKPVPPSTVTLIASTLPTAARQNTMDAVVITPKFGQKSASCGTAGRDHEVIMK